MRDATVNEVGFSITPTINKLTSGTYTAFKIDVTETDVNTGNLLMDIGAGAGSQFTVDPLGLATAKGGIILEEAAQAIHTAHLQLNQTQIQGAGTTPIQIVAAPAAGSYIQVMAASVFYDFTTAAFSTGSVLRLEYASGSFFETLTGFITSGVDRTETFANINGGNIPLATALDVGANADSTGGNAASTMDIYVQYVIIDTSI